MFHVSHGHCVQGLEYDRTGQLSKQLVYRFFKVEREHDKSLCYFKTSDAVMGNSRNTTRLLPKTWTLENKLIKWDISELNILINPEKWKSEYAGRQNTFM
jgi:hypothetical protein